MIWTKGTQLRDKDGIYRGLGPGAHLRYPSVTRIIDGLDGMDMIFVHGSYIADYVRELVHLAKEKKPVEIWDCQVDARTGEKRWYLIEVQAKDALCDKKHISHEGHRRLRKDADRGSVIHELVSQWCDGSGLEIADLPGWLEMTICEEKRSCSVSEVLPYAVSALHWLDKHKPKCIHVDSPVYHDGCKGECPDGWGLYAGTLDFIGELGGRLWLMDFKTSPQSKRAHAMQLAAYRHARWIGLKGSDKRIPMVRVEGVMSVLIQPDKVTPRDWSSTEDWFKAFRHAAKAFQRLDGSMNVQTLSRFVTHTPKQPLQVVVGG